MKKALCAGLVIAMGCAAAPPPPPERPWLPDDSHTGVDHPELQRLLDDHWAWMLENRPVFATRIGVRHFDDRLADHSYESVLAARERMAEFAERARRLQDSGGLSRRESTTAEIFASSIENGLATGVCEFALWSIDPHIGNPLNDFNDLPVLHTVSSEQDGANLVSRYREMPRVLEQQTANLRIGLERGYVANAEAVRLLAELIEAELATDDSPLLRPADAERADWLPEAQQAFAAELREVVHSEIQPAFASYAQFLRDEVLPRARGAENEGIAGIPNGDACYEARVRQLTTLPRATPAELHRKGLNEISWINAAMLEIAEKELGESEVRSLMWRLRLDPNLQFEPDHSEAIVLAAEAALAKARAAIPQFFGTLPKASCEVVPVPDFRAPASPAGYYTMTGPKDARIGRFYLNTYLPETRPRYGIEALTYHESIPGHHLQIAMSQELVSVPAFRKYLGSVAFSEGWALYAERLAVDMGLYVGPLDRIGQLGTEAWRAARLVVDTGLHAFDWTRQEAVDFMLGHTALAQHEIEVEVGRYIANPGQALAYKAGQLEILRLRKDARERLGDRFDIRGFHDAILLGGAVPLPTLQQQVDRWVEAQSW
jgi:uncharacterized protein (DUF885 family)